MGLIKPRPRIRIGLPSPGMNKMQTEISKEKTEEAAGEH